MDDWRAKYEKYISGSTWYRRRKRFLRGHSECLGCHNDFPCFGLHLHHADYDTLGREKKHDLLPLCEGCHDRLHEFLHEHGMAVRQSRGAWTEVFGHKLFSCSGWPLVATNGVTVLSPARMPPKKKRPKKRRNRKHGRRIDPKYEPAHRTNKESMTIRATDSPAVVAAKMEYRRRNSIGRGNPPTGGENGKADKPRGNDPVRRP